MGYVSLQEGSRKLYRSLVYFFHFGIVLHPDSGDIVHQKDFHRKLSISDMHSSTRILLWKKSTFHLDMKVYEMICKYCMLASIPTGNVSHSMCLAGRARVTRRMWTSASQCCQHDLYGWPFKISNGRHFQSGWQSGCKSEKWRPI